MTDPPVTLGEHLWLRRKQLDLSAEAMAKAFGVNAKAYCRWEDDIFFPRQGKLRQVAMFLGLDPSALCGYSFVQIHLP